MFFNFSDLPDFVWLTVKCLLGIVEADMVSKFGMYC